MERNTVFRGTGRLPILIILLILFCSSCTQQNPRTEIRVLVAASARNVVERSIESFRKSNPAEAQCRIVLVSGPSNALAQQIQSGTEAHLFISANPAWTEAIKDHTLLTQNLLANRLVLATAASASSSIESLSDLSNSKTPRIAIAAASVPVGHYAQQVIRGLSQAEQEAIQSKLVFAKDASALVAWLENGIVDAGFVYASDIHQSESLKVAVEINENRHGPIVYTIAKLKPSTNDAIEHVDALYSWLRSEESNSIYRDAGFTIVTERLSKPSRSIKVGE